MTREDLIYTLLRSRKAPQEDNYSKYLENTTNSELRRRINNARVVTATLANILTNKDRKTIRKDLYDLEEKNLQEQKEKEKLPILLFKKKP